jgi:hypothetical protein
VAGDGPERPSSLDDLLPAGAPEVPAPPAPSPAAPPAPAPEPSASSPPSSPAPAPPAPPASEIEEIEALHDEVVRATAACDGSVFGSKVRRQLRAALKHEDQALRQIGCSSYADFAMARTAVWSPRAQGVGAPAEENGASHAEALAPAPAVPEPAAEAPAGTWVSEVPAAPPLDADGVEEIRRELEETRLALRLSQEEVAHTRADFADAIAVRDAAGITAETALAELQQERDRAEAAIAEALNASRHLSEARAELERHRQALAEAAASRSTDDAHRELLEDLEHRVAREQGARVTAEAEALLAAEQLTTIRAELDALQQHAGAAAEDVEARIALVRDEARCAMDEAAQAHDARCAELETALLAANDLLAEARAEAERAARSRDAAVDDVANARVQHDELGSQIGALRSELARAHEEQEQAVLAATAVAAEAADARGALQEELRRAEADRDAARHDTETAQREAAEAWHETAEARRESEAAALRHATDRDEARVELEAAQERLGAEEARVAKIAEELEAVRRELEQAKAAPVDDGQLRRLHDLAGLRAAAERELTDVEDQVERLQDKRQRLKHRIQRQRTRFATERAALDRQLAWARRDAAMQLAALEHRVGVVSSDAATLRAQVAAVRTTLPGDESVDADDTSA